MIEGYTDSLPGKGRRVYSHALWARSHRHGGARKTRWTPLWRASTVSAADSTIILPLFCPIDDVIVLPLVCRSSAVALPLFCQSPFFLTSFCCRVARRRCAAADDAATRARGPKDEREGRGRAAQGGAQKTKGPAEVE